MFRCFLNTEKARQIVPTIKLKRVREDDDVLDLDLSEIECLKRYHTAFRAFVTSGLLYPLSKPLTENDIGKNIQTTIIDWSVAHALQGTAVIDELQANMSYTVLQVSLPPSRLAQLICCFVGGAHLNDYNSFICQYP